MNNLTPSELIGTRLFWQTVSIYFPPEEQQEISQSEILHRFGKEPTVKNLLALQGMREAGLLYGIGQRPSGEWLYTYESFLKLLELHHSGKRVFPLRRPRPLRLRDLKARSDKNSQLVGQNGNSRFGNGKSHIASKNPKP